MAATIMEISATGPMKRRIQGMNLPALVAGLRSTKRATIIMMPTTPVPTPSLAPLRR